MSSCSLRRPQRTLLLHLSLYTVLVSSTVVIRKECEPHVVPHAHALIEEYGGAAGVPSSTAANSSQLQVFAKFFLNYGCKTLAIMPLLLGLTWR